MTALRSSYPVPVADLLPAARSLAAELGTLPSQNRLMRHLHVGKDKAKAVLEELAAERQDKPTGSHLRPVPDLDGTGTEPVSVDDQESASEDTSSQVTPPVVPGSVDVETSAEVVPATPEAETAPTMQQDRNRVRSWPVLLLAMPAFVAVWSGWVGLGEMTGFGEVKPLPGIADGFTINSAITLPIGVETYAAFALRVWLSGRVPVKARRFAKWSALSALVLGALGQVAYHLLEAAGVTQAPWQITTVVACLPVAVLGMGAALAHLIHADEKGDR